MKKNFIAKYFENFGLKQISQILLLVGAITLIVSLFLLNSVQGCVITAIIGSALIVIASAIGIVMHVLTIVKTNRHRVEFKNAVANLVIAIVLLAISIVSIVLCAGELIVY